MPVTPTYVALGTITLSAATNTVTFSGLSQDYKDFIVVMDGDTATSGRPVMRLNGDTSSSYSAVMMASGPYSATSSGTYLDPIPDYSVTGRFSAYWQVMDATATDKHKSVLVRLNQHAGSHTHASAGRYANTTAISSITFLTSTGANYASGTTISLFGVN